MLASTMAGNAFLWEGTEATASLTAAIYSTQRYAQGVWNAFFWEDRTTCKVARAGLQKGGGVVMYVRAALSAGRSLFLCWGGFCGCGIVILAIPTIERMHLSHRVDLHLSSDNGTE